MQDQSISFCKGFGLATFQVHRVRRGAVWWSQVRCEARNSRTEVFGVTPTPSYRYVGVSQGYSANCTVMNRLRRLAPYKNQPWCAKGTQLVSVSAGRFVGAYWLLPIAVRPASPLAVVAQPRGLRAAPQLLASIWLSQSYRTDPDARNACYLFSAALDKRYTDLSTATLDQEYASVVWCLMLEVVAYLCDDCRFDAWNKHYQPASALFSLLCSQLHVGIVGSTLSLHE